MGVTADNSFMWVLAAAPPLCLPYRSWEKLWFPGTTAKMCPVLSPGLGDPLMAFSISIDTDRLFEIVAQGHYAGQAILNRWHFRIAKANPATGDSEFVLDTFMFAWVNSLAQNLVIDYEMDYFIIKRIGNPQVGGPIPTFDAQFVKVANGNSRGIIGGEGLPANVVASFQLRPDSPHKRYRGSKRLSGLPESSTNQASPNHLLPGVVEDHVDAMNLLFSSMQTNLGTGWTCAPVVFSGLDSLGNDLQQAVGISACTRLITSVICNARLGTQKSRHTRREFF